VFCFALSQAQPVTSQFEFEWIAERRSTDAAQFDAGRNTHFQEAPTDVFHTQDSLDTAGLTD
jgi:hypothetical protein